MALYSAGYKTERSYHNVNFGSDAEFSSAYIRFRVRLCQNDLKSTRRNR